MSFAFSTDPTGTTFLRASTAETGRVDYLVDPDRADAARQLSRTARRATPTTPATRLLCGLMLADALVAVAGAVLVALDPTRYRPDEMSQSATTAVGHPGGVLVIVAVIGFWFIAMSATAVATDVVRTRRHTALRALQDAELVVEQKFVDVVSRPGRDIRTSFSLALVEARVARGAGVASPDREGRPHHR